MFERKEKLKRRERRKKGRMERKKRSKQASSEVLGFKYEFKISDPLGMIVIKTKKQTNP